MSLPGRTGRPRSNGRHSGSQPVPVELKVAFVQHDMVKVAFSSTGSRDGRVWNELKVALVKQGVMRVAFSSGPWAKALQQ